MLATTVLQSCIRYQSRTKTCQFCAIGQSLAAGRTVERKTPAQLAEVAKAAVELARRVIPAPDVIHAHDWQTALIPVFVRHRQLPTAAILLWRQRFLRLFLLLLFVDVLAHFLQQTRRFGSHRDE